jgi:hypothetical protein
MMCGLKLQGGIAQHMAAVGGILRHYSNSVAMEKQAFQPGERAYSPNIKRAEWLSVYV